MGTGWKGRACCAKTKVASRAGGTGFSVKRISRYSGAMVRVGGPNGGQGWEGSRGEAVVDESLTSPCFGLLYQALLCLLRFLLGF